MFVPLAAVVLATAAPADAKSGFLTRTHKNADGTESKYVVFVPHTLDPAKPPPAVLFLHGSGETKGGKKQPVDVGIGQAIKTREKTFPFVVVIPQSEKRTWKAGSDDANRALAMFDAAVKEFHADPKRLYLTGLSMGGYGTWSLAVADPDKWAAIAPICGGGDPAAAAKLKELPVWAFHGDADKAVPVQKSRDMVEAVKKAGGKPKYVEYPGGSHQDAWDKAYATDELYDWFLAHTKK